MKIFCLRRNRQVARGRVAIEGGSKSYDRLYRYGLVRYDKSYNGLASRNCNR